MGQVGLGGWQEASGPDLLNPRRPAEGPVPKPGASGSPTGPEVRAVQDVSPLAPSGATGRVRAWSLHRQNA